MKDSPVVILPSASISPRAAWAVFLGVFATLWLLIEPLGLFGLLPTMSILAGVGGYAVMLVLSVIAVLLAPQIYRLNLRKTIPTVEFEISLSSDGIDHRVIAARNMQIWVFLGSFLNEIERRPGGDRVSVLRATYDPVIQILEPNGAYRVLESTSTIFEAGVTEGSKCTIIGKPKQVNSGIRFSRRRASSL